MLIYSLCPNIFDPIYMMNVCALLIKLKVMKIFKVWILNTESFHWNRDLLPAYDGEV